MIDRRTFMAGTAASAAVGGPAKAITGASMLPEWHPHAACVMAWCAADALYGDAAADRIRAEQAKIARAIASFEPVLMLINPDQREDAARQCGHGVSLMELEHYDTWTRDTLPTIHRADTQRCAIGWNFNTWGGKYPGYSADQILAERFASSRGLDFHRAPIVAEGGAIETDGLGTLITTETCLLNENRNPGLSRADIESALMQMTGTSRVIWLWGSEVDAVTDGHVDGICRFIRPGLVVTEVTDDKEDPEYRDLQENAVRLEAARDARGERLEVIRLMRPRWEKMPDRGDDFAPSYVNAYFPNGGVVMPKFGDGARDAAARALFGELEPERAIIQLDISQITEGGGGIHCCTMQVPA